MTNIKKVSLNELNVGDTFYINFPTLQLPGSGLREVVYRTGSYLVGESDNGQGRCFLLNDFGYVKVEDQVIDWMQVKPGTLVYLTDDSSGFFGALQPRHLKEYRPGTEYPFVTGQTWRYAKLAPSDWIFHAEQVQPVPDGVMVEVWTRNNGQYAAGAAENISWDWNDSAQINADDTIAYRITGELADGYQWN